MQINQIISIFQNLCPELSPIATEVDTKLSQLKGVKAVVFDIYGTLFASGAGDISMASRDNRDKALESALKGLKAEFKAGDRDLSAMFYDAISQAHARLRKNGVGYPEVEIREIWKDLLSMCDECSELPSGEAIELAAVNYECLVNPVWPMPGLRVVLEQLSVRFKLGIISNAQFFTPLLFDAFLGESAESIGFEEASCVWSYKLREAKPSKELFRLSADYMSKQYEIAPAEMLYVGNDMRNDIWPASQIGFRTALFAGDERSLRMRENDSDCRAVVPDLIITDLEQILKCI